MYSETFDSSSLAENKSAFFNDFHTFKMRHLNKCLEWFYMYLNDK